MTAAEDEIAESASEREEAILILRETGTALFKVEVVVLNNRWKKFGGKLFCFKKKSLFCNLLILFYCLTFALACFGWPYTQTVATLRGGLMIGLIWWGI